MKLVSIVVPVYNEEDNIAHFTESVEKVMDALPYAYEILFIDDGSRDRSREILRELGASDPHVQSIFLARNCGHQIALTCGIDHADGDAVITMDGDMQHPPALIPTLLAKWEEGFDVVQTIRETTEGVGFLKRATSYWYYKALNKISRVHIQEGGSDFRLMDRRALAALAEYPEVNLFLRGIVPMIGLTHDVVYYTRRQRLAGESKYPWRRMASFAWEGVTSLSARPIRLISQMGMCISFISGLMLIWSVIRHFIGETIVGWTSLVVSLWFLGGLILLSIGVIGEYVGKIYLEVKRRPRYLVQDFIDGNAEQKNN